MVPANVPAADRDRWLFACAATWPDYVWKIRVTAPGDFHKYFHAGWHVIGQPVALDPNAQAALAPLKPPATTQDPNRLTVREALPLMTAVLDDARRPAAERAVALCWVMHLTGDLHEPCHCASLISNRFKAPDGDHVATRLIVIRSGNAHPVGLHQYWDSLFCTSTDWAELQSWDRGVIDDPALQPGALPELHGHPSVDDWIAESYAIAARDVYSPDVRAAVAAQDADPSREWEPVPLGDDYLRRAREIGRRRGALAALRLAATLASVPW